MESTTEDVEVFFGFGFERAHLCVCLHPGEWILLFFLLVWIVSLGLLLLLLLSLLTISRYC